MARSPFLDAFDDDALAGRKKLEEMEGNLPRPKTHLIIRHRRLDHIV
jgi:hypothetical protein